MLARKSDLALPGGQHDLECPLAVTVDLGDG